MKRLLCSLMCVLALVCVVPGCQTTSNGETTVDVEQTRAVLELTLAIAKEALATWEEYQSRQEDRDEAKYQEELQRRREAIAAIERKLDEYIERANP